MDYKVYKYIRHEATLFGLNYSSARIFGVAGIGCLMSILNGFSFIKIVVIASGLTILYTVLLSLQNKKKTGDLPRVIINRTWRKLKQ